jgi:ubiquinone/menaquinone biosynthesis C-methylase UbiE
MDKKAISEMIRILKTGGKLLITVPYGRYEEYGWFRNYDKKHWQELLDTVRPQSNIKELYFKHNKDGWLKCKPGELAQVSYFGQKNYGAAAIAICLITKKID